MKKFAVLSLIALLIHQPGYTQGCIMIRNIQGFGQYNVPDHAFSTSNWQLNFINRYFKAYKEISGREVRKELDPRVNHEYTADITLTRFMSRGWSWSFSLPINANSRSTKYEHDNVTSHTSHSFGLGDARLTVDKWLLPESVKQRANIQLGLGIKLPTGDYKYQDYFYRNDSVKVLAPVGPSIQLGDGGTGIITELNGFYRLGKGIDLYGNFYYLINPKNVNGTSTTFGKAATPLQIKTTNDISSVPDQYAIRAGLNLNLEKISLSAGMRDEGIPVYDLIGDNDGLRRSGHNFSIEPGFAYKLKKLVFYSYLPILVDRKTKQTVPDKRETALTGVYTLRPGGFADYLVFVGMSYKF